MLTAIVAISDNDVIGNNNRLLWHLPDDFRRFKKLTTNHSILMGRKTFESLPGILPQRKHIVITRGDFKDLPDVVFVKSLEQAIQIVEGDIQPFVIGGGEIYRLAWSFLSRLEITRVHSFFDGDTTFPKIDFSEWKLIDKVFNKKNMSHKFDFTYETYLRI